MIAAEEVDANYAELSAQTDRLDSTVHLGACEEEPVGRVHDDANHEIARHLLARFAACLRRLCGLAPESPPGGNVNAEDNGWSAAGRGEQTEPRS